MLSSKSYMPFHLKGLIQLLLMPNIVKSPFKHNWDSELINAKLVPEKRKKQTGALNYRHSRKNETPQAIIKKAELQPCDFYF